MRRINSGTERDSIKIIRSASSSEYRKWNINKEEIRKQR